MTTTTPDPGHDHGRGLDRPHGGDGRFLRTTDSAERDADACRLRSEGQTYGAIAAALGYADRAGAKRAVERALLAIVAEPAANLRSLELDRLDSMWREAWAVLQRPHLSISNGRVVLDPKTGQPLRDDAPVLNAIDRLLRIQERRARLLGLDAPVRAEVLTIDVIEGEIARLGAQLGIIQGEVMEQ